ncbi:N-acetylmuramoyl-L-alanine amidase LytC precursor [Bacillus sp. THAF10]|uniref:SH3 domain-containing protein n=1 Tax=Bacillus sp. THAF10 TaxID=2587848 RepID=UPI001268898C|nr:SH3 domain-containing protein [Bacillus sp. THAF10]QFT90002.1 N-acetylmuramoyl-L-alanine amidase LytC precursor [Bacillus sp. THAF10]
MRQKLPIFLIALLLFTTVFSFLNATSALANKSVVVATDVLNVRESPDVNAKVISKVSRGESYPVVEAKGEWVKIQVTSSKAGWIASYLVVASSEGGIASATRSGGSSSVQVLTDDLRIRSGPGTNFSVVGYFHSTSENIQYLDENENWVKVRGEGLEGWVAKEFVSIQAKKQQEQSQTTKKNQHATITTDGLNIRKEPSTDATVLGTLSTGQQVEVIGKNGDWLNIKLEGTSGWIHGDYATVGEGEPAEGAVLGHATIKVAALNVRSEPSLNGTVIEQLPQGTKVMIVSERNNWCEILMENGERGWLAGWFLDKNIKASSPPPSTAEGSIVIVDDATNIRSAPTTSAKVVHRANKGEEYPIVEIENDWYKIKLTDGSEAFVAGWIVASKGTTQRISRAGGEQYLSNKVIVIDPGHGGRDVGAIGASGTFEKDLTLRTSLLLYDKLRAAGANVFLTRQADTSVPLQNRPQLANYHRADAFISIHYDSIDDSSVTGNTTYFYSDSEAVLAENVHSSLVQYLNLRDRGFRQENYLVLRESMQPSLLLELGYISNRGEELTVKSGDFQERASTAIYQGLAQYFKGN